MVQQHIGGRSEIKEVCERVGGTDDHDAHVVTKRTVKDVISSAKHDFTDGQ